MTLQMKNVTNIICNAEDPKSRYDNTRRNLRGFTTKQPLTMAIEDAKFLHYSSTDN